MPGYMLAGCIAKSEGLGIQDLDCNSVFTLLDSRQGSSLWICSGSSQGMGRNYPVDRRAQALSPAQGQLKPSLQAPVTHRYPLGNTPGPSVGIGWIFFFLLMREFLFFFVFEKSHIYY